MSKEAEKPVKSEASGQPRKSDSSRAVRQFERFMMGVNSSFRVDARREDQGGVWDEHDLAELDRQRRPAEIDPEEGEVIATIIFKPNEGKVVYDFPDGRHIER
jgi:hypothetical protein